MAIFKFSIKVGDYYSDADDRQSLYIESENSPSEKQILEILQKLHENDSQYDEYTDIWLECIETIRNYRGEFPILWEHSIMRGDYYICVERINPIKL